MKEVACKNAERQPCCTDHEVSLASVLEQQCDAKCKTAEAWSTAGGKYSTQSSTPDERLERRVESSLLAHFVGSTQNKLDQ